jgi:predicted dithiol-disulfide oxidoreductase (DUF899 family)
MAELFYPTKGLNMTHPTTTRDSVVSESEWKTALAELTAKEDAHFARWDALNEQRRALPVMEITTPYEFGSPEGTLSLVDLFKGQRQLVLYHFMFAPDWNAGCPHCTRYAHGLGRVGELRELDTGFALVSRASSDKLEAYKASKGWDIPWYSCQTRFSEDMGVLPDESDVPGISVFTRDESDTVYRTYFTNSRTIEVTMGLTGIMDLTPEGMGRM